MDLLKENDNGEILFDLQHRDEAKEEEYDYFDFNQNEENQRGANDYHLMDEAAMNEDDEEILDEDEKRERN